MIEPLKPMSFVKVSIDELDDEGYVFAIFEAEEHYRCGETCPARAFCETCGRNSDTDPILVGLDDLGHDLFACYACVDVDDYIRLTPIEGIERVEPIMKPEDGMYVYPHTAPDGRAVDSRGYVVGS